MSELCILTLSDVDLTDRTLTIRQGKGMADRTIELEKKGLQTIRNYLGSRDTKFEQCLILNYQGEPISERGVQKLLAKYVKLAGITRRISPHSLRHTFATYKAERGVSPYQLVSRGGCTRGGEPPAMRPPYHPRRESLPTDSWR